MRGSTLGTFESDRTQACTSPGGPASTRLTPSIELTGKSGLPSPTWRTGPAGALTSKDRLRASAPSGALRSLFVLLPLRDHPRV